MKVNRIQTDYRTNHSVQKPKAQVNFKASPGSVNDMITNSLKDKAVISFLKGLEWLKGESGGILITAIGTGFVAPWFIAFNPFVKRIYVKRKFVTRLYIISLPTVPNGNIHKLRFLIFNSSIFILLFSSLGNGFPLHFLVCLLLLIWRLRLLYFLHKCQTYHLVVQYILVQLF